MRLSRPSLVHVLTIGLFGLAGLLLGGWPGFVIGVATAAVLEVLGPDAPRRLAVAAAALLAGAAVMTLLEGGTAITDLNLRFPRERPVANTLALAATILVVAILFADVSSERAMSPSPPREHPTALRSPRWRPPGVRPWFTVGILAVLVRVACVPDRLPPGYVSLADNLALGRGYLLGLGSDARPTGILTPLTPLIIAFAPGGPRMVLIAVSTSTVVMTGLLATRLFDRRIGVTAAVVAAMLPSLWGQQLPEALAALAVVVALLLADPYRTSPWRLILAGSAIGVGMLARPEVVLVVPLVICWWMAARDHPPWRYLLAASAILVLVLQPWVGYLHGTFDRWTLSTSLGPTIAAAAAPAATEGSLIGAVDPGARARAAR